MLLLEGVIRVVLKSSQQRFPCHSSAKCELEMHIRDEGDDDDATLTTDEQQTTKQSRSLHSIVNSSKLEYSGCVDGSACHMWECGTLMINDFVYECSCDFFGEGGFFSVSVSPFFKY